MKFIVDTVKFNNLLLDPNNYRFQEEDDFVSMPEDQLHKAAIQDETYSKILRDEGLKTLKTSILTNGFVPIERIVVRPYTPKAGMFLVLEGNRRLAAVKWILKDHLRSVPISRNILNSIRELPVVVLQGDDYRVFEAALMGIRHVSGIKEWGGYQSAKLVVYMRDKLDLSAIEAARRLGTSIVEVNKRYRAYKALQQMLDDEEYGAYARRSMYRLFYEATSSSKIKEWLEWSENEGCFTNHDRLEKFYKALIERDEDEAGTKEPKIKTYQQVRQLGPILGNAEATDELFDKPQGSFQDALDMVQQAKTRSWAMTVKEAIRALSGIRPNEFRSMTDSERQLIEKLGMQVKETLADFHKLRSGDGGK